jgi:hypothetical protein
LWVVADPLAVIAGLEKQLTDLKEPTKYLMAIYVPQEKGVEPKDLVTRLDEAEGRVKALLLDTSKLDAAADLATVKFHETTFNLQKVAKGVDLAKMVNSEDVQAAAKEIIKKVDL